MPRLSELAAILYRYAEYKGCEVSQRGDLTQFVDAGQIHTYAREALSWACLLYTSRCV